MYLSHLEPWKSRKRARQCLRAVIAFMGGLIKLSSRFGCHAACKAIPRVPPGVAIIACSRRNSSTECTGTVLVSLIFLPVSLDFLVSSLPFHRTRQFACFNSEFSCIFSGACILNVRHSGFHDGAYYGDVEQ